MWAPRGVALLPGLGEPQAALPWQRQDVGERNPVPGPPFPPPCFYSLHPSTFKLLALLSHLVSPCPASTGPREEGLDRALPSQSLGSTWSPTLQPLAGAAAPGPSFGLPSTEHGPGQLLTSDDTGG